MSSPTCIPVPNPERLHSIHLDYLGRGTQANDTLIAVGIVGLIALAVVLTTLVYWYYNGRRRV